MHHLITHFLLMLAATMAAGCHSVPVVPESRVLSNPSVAWRFPPSQQTLAKENRVRLAALRAWQAHEAAEPIETTHITKEGDPVDYYLTFQPGRAHFIVDTRRDRFGDGRIECHRVHSLRLGYANALPGNVMRFEPVEGASDPAKPLVLEVVVDDEQGTFYF